HAAATSIFTLSLHDALPISRSGSAGHEGLGCDRRLGRVTLRDPLQQEQAGRGRALEYALAVFSRPSRLLAEQVRPQSRIDVTELDRKSTRLNSSHVKISYAV